MARRKQNKTAQAKFERFMKKKNLVKLQETAVAYTRKDGKVVPALKQEWSNNGKYMITAFRYWRVG